MPLIHGNVGMARNVPIKMKAGLAGDMVFREFLVVLDAFDAKKGEAEDDRQDEVNDDGLLLADLRATHGHRHGQARTDQDSRVDRSEAQVDARTRRGKVSEVPVAI